MPTTPSPLRRSSEPRSATRATVTPNALRSYTAPQRGVGAAHPSPQRPSPQTTVRPLGYGRAPSPAPHLSNGDTVGVSHHGGRHSPCRDPNDGSGRDHPGQREVRSSAAAYARSLSRDTSPAPRNVSPMRFPSDNNATVSRPAVAPQDPYTRSVSFQEVPAIAGRSPQRTASVSPKVSRRGASPADLGVRIGVGHRSSTSPGSSYGDAPYGSYPAAYRDLLEGTPTSDSVPCLDSGNGYGYGAGAGAAPRTAAFYRSVSHEAAPQAYRSGSSVAAPSPTRTHLLAPPRAKRTVPVPVPAVTSPTAVVPRYMQPRKGTPTRHATPPSVRTATPPRQTSEHCGQVWAGENGAACGGSNRSRSNGERFNGPSASVLHSTGAASGVPSRMESPVLYSRGFEAVDPRRPSTATRRTTPSPSRQRAAVYGEFVRAALGRAAVTAALTGDGDTVRADPPERRHRRVAAAPVVRGERDDFAQYGHRAARDPCRFDRTLDGTTLTGPGRSPRAPPGVDGASGARWATRYDADHDDRHHRKFVRSHTDPSAAGAPVSAPPSRPAAALGEEVKKRVFDGQKPRADVTRKVGLSPQSNRGALTTSAVARAAPFGLDIDNPRLGGTLPAPESRHTQRRHVLV